MWAILFPGQGSQRIGMGRFYYEQFQTARRLFEEAEDTLQVNFKKLCFEGPEEDLKLTQNTQPAIVLISCAGWLCLKEVMDVTPIKYCAGHSVGEYSALVASGVLSFSSALKAVRERGLYMADSSSKQKGGMSALIGPTSESAQKFCKWVEKTSGLVPLEPANFNSPEQTVLSGSVDALKWAGDHCQEYDFSGKPARLVPLKVSGAFHSSLMEPARKKMKIFLKNQDLKVPNKILIQNSSAQPSDKPERIKHHLIEQVRAPVLWLQSMQYLLKQNDVQFLEIGEGKTLAGLMRKIDKTQSVYHFHSIKDIHILKSL